MDGKVSITITTDKPITVRVTEDGDSSSEKEGLKRLLDEVKGGSGHVAEKYERRQTAER